MVDIPLLKIILESIHSKFSDVFKNTLKKDISEASEQTVLASIVLILNEGTSFEIITIANGTKSVGKKNMSTQGNLIHDSHAEVLARRAFKKFIFDNFNNPKYFLLNENDKYVRKFKVLFYTSQSPCGQASMQGCGGREMEVEQCNEDITELENKVVNGDQGDQFTAQQSSYDNNSTSDKQKLLFQNTGAKYYHFLHDDKYAAQKDSIPNILRIKPGRTDLPQDARSLSLSCSDKFLQWNVIGLQGSLLGNLLEEPIYIDYLFIESDAKDTKQFKQVIKKGIFLTERFSDKYTPKQLEMKVMKIHKKPISKNYVFKRPSVIVTKKYFFKLNRNLSSNKPKYLDQHIVYIKSYVTLNGERKDDLVEVINGSNGMKWGMGEKGSTIIKNYPSLCKYNLFKAFSEVKHMSSSQCYQTMKQQSIKYHLIKQRLINLFGEQIINKQSYNNFFLQ